MRLVIGGPTRDTVPASFAVDLAQLYAMTLIHGPWSSVLIGYEPSTYVHVGREQFLEKAIYKLQASHVLWLDTDMQLPADTALRLWKNMAEHNAPIVACNCVMRDRRRIFTAQFDGEHVATRPTSTGLQSVDSVGLAVMLMRTDIVRDWPRPWFLHGMNDTGGDIGEDRMFCRALRDAGHEILIDHDLSKEIGHIGQYTYRPVGDATFAV